MSGFIDETADYLDEVNEFLGEEIELVPSGEIATAILTNEAREGGLGQSGAVYNTVEMLNFHLPKSQGELSNRSRFKARGKLWEVDDWTNDETATNGTAFEIR